MGRFVSLAIAALAIGFLFCGCSPADVAPSSAPCPLHEIDGLCSCPGCDCPCRGGDASFCSCKPGTCDCPCAHLECDGDSCRLVEGRRARAAATPAIEAAAGVDAPIEADSGLECPDPKLAGDVSESRRQWYRNLTNPGSCVQCSIGMCGVAQNVPPASLLLWKSQYGPPELHGSYPTRVAEYARKRGMRIWNVTGPGTYEWMKWACRNGRPCAVGCNTAHFQTLFGHDPVEGKWYVVDNNSPQRIDVYSDEEFRRRHRASGEWCVILDYPPGAPRPEYSAWWN